MNSDQTDLPVIRSSMATEDPGTFLGLEGMGVLYVLILFAVTMALADNLPLAVVLAGGLYFALKLYLRGKPPRFLLHLCVFQIRTWTGATTFTHHVSERDAPFARQGDGLFELKTEGKT
ncbi:MAG: hypothetical protein PHV34_08465 [Verrucomicrobiae bacterium]|nr:hypothetical protein [Verrucomicrobiae bacterium]